MVLVSYDFFFFFLALGCCVWDPESFDFTEDMKVNGTGKVPFRF